MKEFVYSTSEEAASWAKTTAFFNNVLAQPWVVSEEDENRAREKAEGRERQRVRAETKNQRKAKKKVSKADQELRRHVKEAAVNRKEYAGHKTREEGERKVVAEGEHERQLRRQRRKHEKERALRESGDGQ